MAFGGTTYDPALDSDRLTRQLGRVYEIMRDGAWRSLDQIVRQSAIRFGSHDTEAAVSARLRDLRKPRFGAYTVERHRVEGANGYWVYRLDRNGRLF